MISYSFPNVQRDAQGMAASARLFPVAVHVVVRISVIHQGRVLRLLISGQQYVPSKGSGGKRVL